MKDFLPIGTVIMIKGGTKKVMIIGYCPVTPDNKQFDYSGCMWPEGSLSSDKTLMFNHDQIEFVYYKGLSDGEQQAFIMQLNSMLDKQNEEQ